MFSLFIGCALIPVAILATVSFLIVRSNQQDVLDRRIRKDSKAAGMIVIGRLQFLETDLRLIGQTIQARAATLPAPASVELHPRFKEHFRNVSLVTDGYRVVWSATGTAPAVPGLDDEQRAHVRSGKTALTAGPSTSGPPVLALVQLADDSAPDGRLLVGEVNQDFLWEPDGLVAAGTEMVIYGADGVALFSTVAGSLPTSELAMARTSTPASGRFRWVHDGDGFVAGYWTLFLRPQYLTNWLLVEAEPEAEYAQSLRQFAWLFSMVVLSAFLVVLILVLRQVRRRTVPVDQLLEATRRLGASDYAHRVRVDTDDEFATLGDAFNEMAESMQNHLRVIRAINEIGVSLSAERDEAVLLRTVLTGVQTVFNADAAAIFLLSKNDELELALANIRSLGVTLDAHASASGGVSVPNTTGLPPFVIPPVKPAEAETVTSADIYSESSDRFARLIEFDRQTGYRSRSFVSVPLRNHEQEVIGVFFLINAQQAGTNTVIPFSEEDVPLMASLASQAAVALTKNRLVDDFKGLFEGMTELISTAIDEQSPHTGGHVRRVVVLSGMIAEALARSDNPTLKDQALSADELYELRIAALLHDCGKLTTPVYLTDKRTKLEGVSDRFRLIEARADAERFQFRMGLLTDAFRTAVADRANELLARVDASAAEHDRQLDDDLAALPPVQHRQRRPSGRAARSRAGDRDTLPGPVIEWPASNRWCRRTNCTISTCAAAPSRRRSGRSCKGT